MATNYVQVGNNITVTAPGTISSGTVVAIGNLIGIAAGSANSGQPLDLIVSGVFNVAKAGAEEIAAGDPVFWDGEFASAEEETGSVRLGTAVAAAGNGAATVRVRLVSI